MARPLEVLSDFLPLSYAYDALQRAGRVGADDAVLVDAVAVLGSTAVALALGAATLRRRTP